MVLRGCYSLVTFSLFPPQQHIMHTSHPSCIALSTSRQQMPSHYSSCQPYTSIALRSAHPGLRRENTREDWEDLCMTQHMCIQLHSCKCPPKHCFTRPCGTGNSSHCSLYLDTNLSGDITRHGNLDSSPIISWATYHLHYAVRAGCCGQVSLCMAVHSSERRCLQ